MPYRPITVDGLDDTETEQLNTMLEQLADTTIRNLLRASYYDGKRAVRQVGTIIPPIYRQLAIVLGWSAKAVDILSRRCNLDGFVWPGGNAGALDALGVGEVWEGNDLDAEISAATISSLIHGPAFLINTGATDDDEPKSLVHVKDALNCTGIWNGRKRRLDCAVSVTGRDSKGKLSDLVLYLDGETVTLHRDGDAAWEVAGDRVTHAFNVPVEPLVYKRRPGRPFGTSRISRPVMSLHDQALRTVLRMEAHSDVYSFPDMWLLGADESIFRNADGSQKAAWQIVLGRIKGVPDDENAETPRADVKRFDAASPEPHLLQLKQQAQLFSGETSIPLTSLGVSDMSNPTSADSYIASREDLIAEAEGATDDWSPAIRRCMLRALAIQNDRTDIPDEWRSIEPRWRSPIYLSRAAAADAGAKIIAVVPWLAETEVGLDLLGLDAQQIRQALADRRRNRGRQVIAELDAADAAAAATTGATVGSPVA